MARRRFQYQGVRRAYQYAGMRVRSGYRKRGGARGIAGLSLPWIGGAALGYFAPRVHPYQDVAITIAAVLPIRLPYGIQNIARGYVLGTVARNIVPGLLGQGSSGSPMMSTGGALVA